MRTKKKDGRLFAGWLGCGSWLHIVFTFGVSIVLDRGYMYASTELRAVRWTTRR